MKYAKKGNLKSRFADDIWKNMGKDKNGWVEISFAEWSGDTTSTENVEQQIAAAGELTENDRKYTEAYNRAAGLSLDGKFDLALNLYKQAQEFKNTVQVQQQITAMEALLEQAAAEKAEEERLAQEQAAAEKAEEERLAQEQKAEEEERLAQEKKAEYAEYLETANQSYKDKDFQTALVMYQSAYDIKETAAVKKKITACEKKTA